VSYLISRAINKTPFFETLARQEGLDLPSAEEQRERRVLRVEDAMSAKPPRVINALTLASHALERLTKEQTTETLITVDWRHWGVLHRAELEAAVAKGRGQDRLEDIFEMRELPRVYPDLPLDSAMRMVGSHEVLPVLNRANQHQIMGTLTLADIHKAYGIAQKIMAKTPAE
jgi:chloride channel protein, CIC family